MSKLPNVSTAVKGWELPITFYKITKTIIEGFLEEAREEIKTTATIQAMKSIDLLMLPDGQRSFSNKWLHSSQNIDIENDDLILLDDGIYYRVLNLKPYKRYGFTEFFLTEDKNGSGI